MTLKPNWLMSAVWVAKMVLGEFLTHSLGLILMKEAGGKKKVLVSMNA